MTETKSSDQDGAKTTNCEGHKQTLERLSTVLPFSVIKKLANKSEDFESIAFDDLFVISTKGGLDAGEFEFPDFSV